MSMARAGWLEGGCWILSAALTALAHVAVALSLMAPADGDSSGPVSGGFVIELTALPVARADVPDAIAPGPDQIEAAAVPEIVSRDTRETHLGEQASEADEKVERSPAVDPELTVPEQRPAEEPATTAEPPQEAETPAPTTTAMQTIADVKGAVASASVQAPPQRIASVSLPTWRSQLEIALERSKRYPAGAQARHQHGVVHVTFVIDREGRLISSRIDRGSGHAVLDEEALALLQRAQPFPPLPDEIAGAHVILAVPIRFNLR